MEDEGEKLKTERIILFRGNKSRARIPRPRVLFLAGRSLRRKFMKPVADSRFAVSIGRARESVPLPAARLLTYSRRVLRTIITRISLRNSPAIESAGNIIRSPDLARSRCA